jgi:hypothetical protein
MTTHRRITAAAALALGLGLLAAAPVGAAGDDALMTQVQNAKTPADHLAVADAYAARAKDARAEAQMHREMAKNYRSAANQKGNIGGLNAGMVQHCNTLAKSFDAEAKEYDAIAQAHRQLAAATK